MNDVVKNRTVVALLLTIMATLGIMSCRSSEGLTKEETGSTNRTNLAMAFDTSDVFSGNFTGFALYDPAVDSMIYAQNERRYFTPASNTKLFTFYTGLKLLPEKLPALQYVERGDSLVFWGTGDPSFLRSDLDNGLIFEFLKNSTKELYYSDSHYRDEGLGPGWAWGDYQYAYSAEKSPFPMYGNMVEFKMQEVTTTSIRGDSSGLNINPPLFREYLEKGTPKDAQNGQLVLERPFSRNTFRYLPASDTSTFTIHKPYHYTPQLIVEMLSDTLDKPVQYVKEQLPENPQKLYSVNADTLYKKMLQPSDNFIAEQLLLASSSELEKPLNTATVIDTMKETHLSGMPDEPQWVDGSGLSRYNMFTPRSMIWLLQQIDKEFKSDKNLFELLAIGGEKGTIRHWYGARDGGPPYIFAKTGTLSNNHCLSGYILTESGNKLLFSFMNNHYVGSSSMVKREMEKVLWFIHQQF
ncbi:D-alanyl-D-alanine carboxypeptidase/D-alanyl-D-alanine-endopeptidase [Fodinibius salsisoli]|uniref:D-alanyl-D-alanine carboxypeptidase n=1 Tax=Fodinibius salsisoli TaxID=2820877 RepID=A0ABT3PRQ2_9BACT|nr:D-alanyl-D-alanine carboxypeptidase [Fodinibius salsisoli]MCW9708544.1 D-alanyl-D-alanine carboxypeptidase [Fodinibius salsisoli]